MTIACIVGFAIGPAIQLVPWRRIEDRIDWFFYVRPVERREKSTPFTRKDGGT